MATTRFGLLPDGSQVDEVTIGVGDFTAKVINLGAVIRDVRLAGVSHPLVLGFDRLEDYVNHSPHFGAVAGRSANRIARGNLVIDGKHHQLPLNERGQTHLHGGENGFGRRVWRFADHDARSVTLTLTSPDGEEGYPGRVEATVRYTVEAPGALKYEAEAVTDAPTVVNLAQHSYFNLDDSAEILDHRVQILADEYTPFDANNIPTGEILSVAGTDYDFRAMRPIRHIRNGRRFSYDINFVVDRKKTGTLRPIVRIESEKGNVALDIASTEPGVQFYDGNLMGIPAVAVGLDGRRYGVCSGVCFEPQFFPDSPNHPNFPSPILRPGETYRQTTVFAFSRG